jgi:chromosome segregation ATPase
MAKKAVLTVGLGAGLMALLFGTAASSYFKTALHWARSSARDAVPIQFQIDRAKQLVAELEPAIHKNIEEIVRTEVEIEHLQREIETTAANLETEADALIALRKHLNTGDLKLTSGRKASPEEIRAELARRMDHYKSVKAILADKQKTLELRRQALAAAREQNAKMRDNKQALLTQIEAIETRLKQIEATNAANEFHFDDSALARAKQTVSELEKRVEVMARIAEQEGRFSGGGFAIEFDGRDVVKEVDAEFGTGAGSVQPTTGRSL